MTDDTPFDALETRSAEEREAALFDGFGEPGSRAAARRAARARRPPLTDTQLEGGALARRPRAPAGPQEGRADGRAARATRRSAASSTRRPSAARARSCRRGPVFEMQLPGSDPWDSARALHAAGFRAGMTVHNAFSYHQTPGGFILDEGARALGCTVFPAGVGNTEMQVEAIRRLRPSGWTGTPDYLRALLDHAAGRGAEDGSGSGSSGEDGGGSCSPSRTPTSRSATRPTATSSSPDASCSTAPVRRFARTPTSRSSTSAPAARAGAASATSSITSDGSAGSPEPRAGTRARPRRGRHSTRSPIPDPRSPIRGAFDDRRHPFRRARDALGGGARGGAVRRVRGPGSRRPRARCPGSPPTSTVTRSRPSARARTSRACRC